MEPTKHTIAQKVEVVFGNRGTQDDQKHIGVYHIEHLDKDGNLLSKFDVKNDITTAGKNSIYNIMFNSATQITGSAWCLGLISNAGFSALAAGDTMSSHSGWSEYTGVSNSVRPAWGSGSASGGSITNSSPVTFNINAGGTLYGIFVTSDNTIGGTAGVLWSTAAFSSTVPVNIGDQIKVTYTLSS